MGASRPAVVALAALLIAAAAHQAAAATLALEPDRDNAMSQDDPTYASGAGSSLFIGAIASGGARRALLRFDLTSIPAGSVVNAVSLRFTISKAAPQSGFDPATLHRVAADWGEGTSNGGSGGALTQASTGDATWDHRFYGNPPAVPRVFWARPGGDFDATASGGTTVGGVGTYTIATTPQLVADVQAWVNQPASNFGWIMLGNETDSQSARRILGRSAFSPAERPLLTVEYAPPGSGGGPPGSGGPPVHQVPVPAAALAVLAVVLGAIGAHARAADPSKRWKTMKTRVLVGILAAALCSAAGASIVHDETANGDLSNDGLAPTRLVMQTGINTLIGGTGAGDRDYLFFEVPAGSRFEALYVRPGTTVRGQASFIGVQAGNVFSVPPDTASAAGLLGWRLYARADIDTDILPLMGAAGDGASGFTPPLPAGAYAFWIQELGQATTYRFDFEIALVPEPGTWTMLLAGLALLGWYARGPHRSRARCRRTAPRASA